MKEISQMLLIGFGAAAIAAVMLYLFIGYSSEPAVAYEPQRVYTSYIEEGVHGKRKVLEDYVKATDMKSPSAIRFYYPNSEDVKNRDVFQLFTLIRLPEYLGGAQNDTSAFRAYSALDITSHCQIRFWPMEGRDDRIEDPCQSAGYRVLDGVAIHPHAKNLRGPSTGALAQLDLDIDEQGYLRVLPPVFTEEKNGVVGVGRAVSDKEINQVSKILLEIYSAQLPESSIIPFTINDYYFHYAHPENIPRFDYYHKFAPTDFIRLFVNPANYCDLDSWRPPKHGFVEQSFGIDDKTIYYEIRDDQSHSSNYVYMDFCLGGNLYSMESNVQFERLLQIVVDAFIYNSNLKQ